MNFATDNWFELVQTLAIIASFATTWMSFRKAEKTTKVGNSLLVTQHHRELWTLFFDHQDELQRVFADNCNLERDPITEKESMFITMLFLHLSAVLKASKSGAIYPVEGMKADIKDLFEYPVPRAVWANIRDFQDKATIDFVDSCLRARYVYTP